MCKFDCIEIPLTINVVSVRPLSFFQCTFPIKPLGEMGEVVVEQGQLHLLSKSLSQSETG